MKMDAQVFSLLLAAVLLAPGCSEKRPRSPDAEEVPATLRASPTLADWLLAGPFAKTSSFDLDRQPASVRFDSEGRFIASFPERDCAQEAPYQLALGRLSLGAPESARCAPGCTGTFLLPGLVPWKLGEVLVLCDLYWPAEAKGDRNLFAFGFDKPGVSVQGEYLGQLRAGTATEVDFTFAFAGGWEPKKLGSFSIRLVRLDAGGLSTGPEETLLSKSFAGAPIGSNRPRLRETLALAPGRAGPADLVFRLTFEDAEPPHEIEHTYRARVMP